MTGAQIILNIVFAFAILFIAGFIIHSIRSARNDNALFDADKNHIKPEENLYINHPEDVKLIITELEKEMEAAVEAEEYEEASRLRDEIKSKRGILNER